MGGMRAAPGKLAAPSSGARPMRTLVVLLIAASMLPLTALLGLQVWHETGSHLEDARQLIQGVATGMANETSRSLQEIERSLSVIAQRPQVRALDAAHCDPLFDDIRTLNLNVVGVASLDQAGKQVCSSLSGSGMRSPSFGNTAWFRRLSEGQAQVVGPPGYGPISWRWVAFVGTPIRDASGAFAGAAVMTIDLEGLEPAMHPALPEDAAFAIIDRTGTVVARSAQMPEPPSRSMKDTPLGRAALGDPQGTKRIVGEDGVERLYGWQPVAGTDWTIAAGMPTQVVYAQFRESLWRNGIGLLVALSATTLLGLAVFRKLTRPLAALRDASHAIAQGSRETRALPAGPREVSELALAFNHMLDRVLESDQAAREHEDHYRRLFLASPEAICVLQAGRIVMANPAAGRLFDGSMPGDLLGREAEGFVHPRDRADAHDCARRVLVGGSEREHAEIEIVRADGSAATAELTLVPFPYRGKPAALALVVDISDQRRMEGVAQAQREAMEHLIQRQVAVHTAQAVAHEINQPLGAVSAYCEAAIFMLDHGTPSPEKLRQALERGVEQAHRAGNSLHELVAYLHRDDEPAEPFDLALAIGEALKLLDREACERCQLSVRVEPGLAPVLGNKVQVVKVLVNLVHNALEACSSAQATPCWIRITADAQDGLAMVSVLDSGSGMSERSAGRLFTPFSSSKPSGMGLGLVISRALVAAQGGQLWCERGSAGAGALFRFTIPLAA